MKLKHHGLEIELDDAWWIDAGMEKFEPSSRAYTVDLLKTGKRDVFEVAIVDIREVSRSPGIGVFNDNDEASAQTRVVRLLRGFVSGAAIPPVVVVREPAGSRYSYKLTAGAHRLYCSLAAGFTHVPAVEGFDFNAF